MSLLERLQERVDGENAVIHARDRAALQRLFSVVDAAAGLAEGQSIDELRRHGVSLPEGKYHLDTSGLGLRVIGRAAEGDSLLVAGWALTHDFKADDSAIRDRIDRLQEDIQAHRNRTGVHVELENDALRLRPAKYLKAAHRAPGSLAPEVLRLHVRLNMSSIREEVENAHWLMDQVRQSPGNPRARVNGRGLEIILEPPQSLVSLHAAMARAQERRIFDDTTPGGLPATVAAMAILHDFEAETRVEAVLKAPETPRGTWILKARPLVNDPIGHQELSLPLAAALREVLEEEGLLLRAVLAPRQEDRFTRDADEDPDGP